jgi:hypothetical protein
MWFLEWAIIISLIKNKPTVYAIAKYFVFRERGTEFLILIRSIENQSSSILFQNVSQNSLLNVNQEIVSRTPRLVIVNQEMG